MVQRIQLQGNFYDKYNTKNPIAVRIMKGFYNSIEDILVRLDLRKVLDAGCGEGEITSFIKKTFKDIEHIEGFDIGNEVIDVAKKQFQNLDFSVRSIYNTTYHTNAFDLVICLEVLEHLTNPRKALEELTRISSKHILISVPNEPIWRISNIIRGKYLKDLGNTPGHINHFSKADIIKMVKCYGTIQIVKSPFPWTMILFEKF